jgi:VCBS repeat-containing protein
VVTWNYSVAASDVEYLAAGQTKIETFSFNVLDGQGGSVSRTVTVTITGTNDAPVAVADTGTIPENATLTINAGSGVLVNDTDLDTSDTHIVSEVNGVVANVGAGVTGTNGGTFTIAADGSYTFNPGTSFNDLFVGESRTTSVTYTNLDSNGLSATSTLTITVTGVNAIPVTPPPPPSPPVAPPILPPSPFADPPVIIIPVLDPLNDPSFTAFDNLLQLANNGVVSYGDGTTDNIYEYDLYLVKTPSSQEILVDEVASFNLPTGTFRHSNSSAKVTLEASLADGRPLPDWLTFDPDSGRFTGKPPKGTGGSMDIKVMARDDRGNVVFTQFLLHITELESNDAKTLKELQNDSNAEGIDFDRQRTADLDKDKPQLLKKKYAAYGRPSLSDQFMHQQLRGRNETLIETLRRATARLQ